jgi:hypothetical protein
MKRKKGLQEALLLRQGSLDRERISAVGVELDFIGSVPNELALKTRMLYLSNNNLHSLNGIQQFQNLEMLSVSNNNIVFLEELYYLINLKNLKKLQLIGNPVTKIPFYIDFTIGYCPRLEQIDGSKLTEEDRAKSKLNCFRATRFFSRAVSNRSRNSILIQIIGKQLCHAELSRKIFSRFRYICYR